ncbi:hypothetical protein PHYBOEH_006533 [Phytophthora boehmeriae]|uniref:Uncharacterized protein n=1 Tax=Phytophthora boehmeriae TaxID=109152 RepID=A0A8T1WIQ3_9STRA|nr:hypothetical protein PHYBOEH_006533 [Phytophthora boehmeriae]
MADTKPQQSVVDVESGTTNAPSKSAHRRRNLCATPTLLPILALVLVGLVAVDVVMETKMISLASLYSCDSTTTTSCIPKILNPAKIKYHSGHRYYSTLQAMDNLPSPVFRDELNDLCYKKMRNKKQYAYCLPISGRKDTPYCTAADRMDLLNVQSPKSVCYASVLHMIMVEVYEELQASKNTPFLAFGSMLGAVRNGSMIPFTEDADVGFVGSLHHEDALRIALRQKGYHMFHMGIWRVCVAPTHPLAGRLFDSSLPVTKNYAVPYLDLYSIKQQKDGSWDMQEFNGTNGSIIPDDKVMPFSKVTINGVPFDTVRDPKFFLEESYGPEYMTPKRREDES